MSQRITISGPVGTRGAPRTRRNRGARAGLLQKCVQPKPAAPTFSPVAMRLPFDFALAC